VFPLVFGFFIGVAPEGVAVMTDISKYLDFVLKLFIAFGIAFEVPIATILMCWTGMTTPDKLVEKRAYVIVGAFVIGMLMTPPDIVSQTLLAMPMWMLFEVGIFFARRFTPRRASDEYADTEEAESENSIMPPAASAAAVTPATAQAAGDEEEQEEDTSAATEEEATEEEEPYEELTDEEMEAELDRMEEDEAKEDETSAEDKNKKQ
jgi:sec-independent protein translocase protein TatC